MTLKRKKELHRSFECAIQITYFCTLFWGVQFLLMGVQRKMRFGCIGRALYHSSQSFPNKRPRFGEVFCLSRPASGQGGIAPPVRLNQTTTRFENVTPVALLTERKRFQDAIGTPGAPFHFRFSPGRPAQIIDVVGSSPTGGAQKVR